MGEKSKNIGERGEKIVNNFLQVIGWQLAEKGEPIRCIKKEHETESHGIDYLYSYKCPLNSKTLENLIISVKFSEDPYPASKKTDYKGLKSVFRNHIKDLAHTIECFKKSSLRNRINRQKVGVNKSNETGVLFWLTDADNDQNTNVIDKISNVKLDNSLSFDIIYLVDNNRMNFILDSMRFAKTYFNNTKNVSFDYISTGSNVDIINRKTHGKILPIQYINSPLLPIRIELENGEKILLIASLEKYNSNDLKRLLGLAQSYVLSYQMKTIIGFPDFFPNQSLENIVTEIKNSFEDSQFANNIDIQCYNPNHRNL